MTRAERIETTLADGIALEHIEVIDESGNHSVPDGAESHFKVVVVSDAFEGKRQLQRHQMVYKTLGDLMGGEIHALSIQAKAPGEA